MSQKAVTLLFDYALLVALSAIWGSSYLFMKIAASELPPLTLAASRVSGAAVLLILILLLRQERLPDRSGPWGRLTLQALLNAVIPWTLLAWGLAHVDAGLASILNSMAPIFVVILTLSFSIGAGLPRPAVFGAFWGFVGISMIVGVNSLSGFGTEILAQLACIVASIFYASAMLNGRYFKGLSPLVVATVTMVLSTFVLVPVAMLFEGSQVVFPSPAVFGAALVLSFVCTGLAMLIYFHLIQRLGAMGTSSQAYLRTAFGVLLGMVILGEDLTLSIGFGLLITISAVIMINWTPRSADQA